MDTQSRGHVLVGAIVTFVFGPYSGGTLIGGALAGYLEGSDLPSGSLVGVMAGIVALVASMALIIGTTLLGGANFEFMDLLWEGILDPARDGIIPLVVFPLIGGTIGAYVHRETDS